MQTCGGGAKIVVECNISLFLNDLESLLNQLIDEESTW